MGCDEVTGTWSVIDVPVAASFEFMEALREADKTVRRVLVITATHQDGTKYRYALPTGATESLARFLVAETGRGRHGTR